MNPIFTQNEKQANHYTTQCLLLAVLLLFVAWILNLTGFFAVNPLVMNIVSPIVMALLALPSVLNRCYDIQSPHWKYAILGILLVGVTLLCTLLTLHTVLLWACPLLLSCHYYNPKLTRFVLWGSLVGLAISLYGGMYIGVWDSNIMHDSHMVSTIVGRVDYIQTLLAQNDSPFQRVLQFYFLPRAMLLCLLYFACTTLSQRTHRLFTQYQQMHQQKQQVEAELSVAQSIQTGMLPSIFPAFPDCAAFDLYATMHPAKLVGGDFYDFFRMDDDHIALVVADVSGKGVPGALFMMISKTLLKNSAKTTPSPQQVLETVNNQLCEGNQAEMFVTVWLGIYEISSGVLTAANAGHEYPICKRADEGFTLLKDRHGLVLAGLEGSRYQEYQLQLAPGDAIYLYTDGVTEATNAQNELFGTARLLDSLNAHKDADMTTLLHCVKQDIDTFVGDAPQFDDITMLGFQVK